PGFDPARVLTLETAVSPVAYAESTIVQRFLDPAIAAVARVPGVEAVGAISALPYRDWGINSRVRYDGTPNTVRARWPVVEERLVTPGYFQVTRQRLIEGRLLRDGDPETMVVANEALAKRDFPGQDALGKRFYDTDSTFGTIVGIVSDVRNAGPIEDARPELYSVAQSASVYNLMVRVRAGDPRSVT